MEFGLCRLGSIVVAGLLVVSAAHASTPVAGAAAADETITLWPGDKPPAGGGLGPGEPERVSPTGAVSDISSPRMVIRRLLHPDGTAILIVGGGGYYKIGIAHEAVPTADWLSSLGVTPVILYYRLPADGWAPIAPFQDAQRAMRLLRARAKSLGIDPDRIGIIGYSAGGNLAGIIATRGAHEFYKPEDIADDQSSRPDFVGLIYPVSSLQPPYNTTHTSRELMRQAGAEADYTVQDHVSGSTPPIFIAQAEDDPIVNVSSTLALYDTLRIHHVPAELHLFDKGGHGWGLGRPQSRVSTWPSLFAGWMREHGWLHPSR